MALLKEGRFLPAAALNPFAFIDTGQKAGGVAISSQAGQFASANRTVRLLEKHYRQSS